MFKRFWNWILYLLLNKIKVSKTTFTQFLGYLKNKFKEIDTNNDKYISIGEFVSLFLKRLNINNKFINWLINKIFSLKLINETQYNNIIYLLEKSFKEIDTNNDKYISLKEFIDFVRRIY